MVEETAVENGRISHFEGLVTFTSDRSYCMPLCISRRLLPTSQMPLKWKKIFVDRRTYVLTHRRTFETGFISSTLSKSRPRKVTRETLSQLVSPSKSLPRCDEYSPVSSSVSHNGLVDADNATQADGFCRPYLPIIIHQKFTHLPYNSIVNITAVK